MIAPDLETGIARLRELIEAARVVLPFTGAGISTECGIPDFRSPGGMWTKNRPIPFDEFLASQEMRNESWRRRFAMEEHSRRRGPAAAIWRWRASTASGKIAGRDHAEHRQSASGFWNCAGRRGRAARQQHLCAAASIARTRYELAWVKEQVLPPAAAGAGLSRLRRPDQDRDRFVRAGDAGSGHAPRRGTHARLRSLSRGRLLAGGLAGGGISVAGQAQRRATCDHQSRGDRVRRRSPIWSSARISAPCSRR